MAMFMDIETEPLRKRKCYREIFNPLSEFEDDELYQRFRFSSQWIQQLVMTLQDDLPVINNERGRPISQSIQVMIAIRYLASNAFQNVIADTFNVSQSSVSLIISKFIDALARHKDEFIKFPRSNEEISLNKNYFYSIARMPMCIGLIDGTHIKVCPPAGDEASYLNRKNVHSVNVQVVTGRDGKIIHLDASWPGRTHDSFVLRNSDLFHYLEENSSCGIILGDSGYPLRNWLFTPYLNPSNTEQRRYNSAHRKTRVEVEQVFGRWKRRFAILHSVIRLPIDKVPKVIICCGILHNMAIELRLPFFDETINSIDDSQPSGYTNEEEDNHAVPYVVRDHFVANNFS